VSGLEITGMTVDGSQQVGPVAIGGVGGSGTRVVAGFLRQLGFYMGADLNAANDNLWFALLLARSRWFAESPREEILMALSVFERAMTGHFALQRDELGLLVRAAYGMASRESLFWRPTRIKRAIQRVWPLKWALTLLWATKRIATIAQSARVDLTPYAGWGWKEPCTYVYITYLNSLFKDFRYIHVMRNGLDMAYSGNQGHLVTWGSSFGVQMPDAPELLPRASLRYWIKANETTIARGTSLLGDRFLVINFDQLCLNPQSQVACLLDFLELDCSAVDVEKLCQSCTVPRSLGRYREYDADYSLEAIDAVRRLGFSVDDQWLSDSAEKAVHA
jgi:hypothetical protein